MSDRRAAKPPSGGSLAPGRLWLLRALVAGVSAVIGVALAVLVLEALYFQSRGALFCHRAPATAWSLCEKEPDVARQQSPYRSIPSRSGPEGLRIVTLGGSTTYGKGLPNEESWPYLLEKLFAEADPETRVSVDNLGYLGGHLEQIRGNLSRISQRRITRYEWVGMDERQRLDVPTLSYGIEDLRPDVLLLAPIINDTIPDLFMGRHWTGGVCRWLRLDPVLSQLAVTHYVCELSLTRRFESKPHDLQDLPEVLAGFEGRLRSFVTEVEGSEALRGTKLVLMTLPGLFAEGEPSRNAHTAARFWGGENEASLQEEARLYPAILAKEEDVIEHVAREFDLPFVSLREMFAEYPFRQRLQYFSDSVHTNSRGTALVAAAVHEAIEGLVVSLTVSEPSGVDARSDGGDPAGGR